MKKLKLSSFYGEYRYQSKRHKLKSNRLLILQRGEKRSLVLFTDNHENPVLLMNNDQVEQIEKMGLAF